MFVGAAIGEVAADTSNRAAVTSDRTITETETTTVTETKTVRKRARAVTVTETTTAEAQPSDTGGGGGCSPDYEGACVPNDAGDVNCADIPQQDFSSVGSDPYGLDRDGDGIACES